LDEAKDAPRPHQNPELGPCALRNGEGAKPVFVVPDKKSLTRKFEICAFSIEN
jgi:hypothetical protein